MNINMKNSIFFEFLPISNVFIDRYITKANAVYICIYIYLLKHCFQGENITLKKISEEFKILESDTLNSLKFWQKEGLINFKECNDEIFIDFLNINNPNDTKININPEDDKQGINNNNFESEKENKQDFESTIRTYSVDEINVYKETDEVKRLFSVSEKAFSTMLDFKKMQFVFGLYDWLGMSIELIEYLIKYCKTKGKIQNLRYIETVAISWKEEGVDTVEKAEERINNFNKKYREILKALGLATALPIESQIKFMDDWLSKLDIEIIKEACQRTVIKTGKPVFEYTDTIINSWANANVKTISDIQKMDSEFKKKNEEKASVNNYNNTTNNSQNRNKKKTKFDTYEQRDWDYDKLNQIKRELLEKNN